jgi:hypothetical protein
MIRRGFPGFLNSYHSHLPPIIRNDVVIQELIEQVQQAPLSDVGEVFKQVELDSIHSWSGIVT